MRRRDFLHAVAVTSGTAVLGPMFVQPAGAARRHPNPYGDIEGLRPDRNGILLPEGFESRLLAESDTPVAGTDFTWPIFPDGAATFPKDGGGWYLAVNSENPVEGAGGVSVIAFDDAGEVTDAYSILQGTTTNCAGGPTPWGTWLSCEETETGQVWECDPTQAGNGEARPAMGAFRHEAVAVDPGHEQLFLTEDVEDGRFYRFVPESYPDLGRGTLEVARVADDGAVTWMEVADPSGRDTPTRQQLEESTAFDGGEGIWFHDGSVFFGTKGDNHIRRYDTEAESIEVVYDGSGTLKGVDNVTVEEGTGTVYVAEDGDNMELVIVSLDGHVTPFLRVVDEGTPPDGLISEMTGPVFSPDGRHLYFGSQRGGPGNRGMSYAVTGPFEGAGRGADPTATTEPNETASGRPRGDDGDDGTDLAVPLVGGAMGLGVIATGLAVWRVRTRGASGGSQ